MTDAVRDRCHAAHQNRLRSVALPYLHQLADMTGMVVHLAVLDGPEIVYLDKIGGSLAIAPRGRTSRSITTDHRLRQELSWVRDRS